MKPLGSQIILHRVAGLVFDREGRGAKFIIGGHFVFQRQLIWVMLCLKHFKCIQNHCIE